MRFSHILLLLGLRPAEKKVHYKTVALVSTLQGDIDSKTWWRIRDQLRGTDVYSLRSSMLAINGVLPTEKKPDAAKAYTRRCSSRWRRSTLRARRRSRRSPPRRTTTCSRPSLRMGRSLTDALHLSCGLSDGAESPVRERASAHKVRRVVRGAVSRETTVDGYLFSEASVVKL